MPESSKTMLLELSERFKVDGLKSVLQRYPDSKNFLLVLPEVSTVWTSSNPTILGGKTTLTKIDTKSLKNYTFPNAVVIPIQKAARNSYPYICVGRHEDADIRFNSKQISKNHAGFYIRENGRLLLQDLCSTNGTFIDEAPSYENQKYFLDSGTEITFGDVRTLYLDLDGLLDLLK